MNLKVNDIFYSIQGEGGRFGEASIFIRLSNCNLRCSFCDTEFDSGEIMSIEDINNKISDFKCNWIIWTGGEPTIQLTSEITSFFKHKGYLQAIETNGTRPIPQGIDYIACSPKVDFYNVKNIIPYVDELRFAVKYGDSIPDISYLPKTKRYLLSPIFDGEKIVMDNVNYCIEIIKKNPKWALSLQIHKLIDVK